MLYASSTAVGGSAQSASGGSSAGSGGCAGVQSVATPGSAPTGAPFTGKLVPLVVLVVQAVTEMRPCRAAATPLVDPVGRTSPTPSRHRTPLANDRTPTRPPPPSAVCASGSPSDDTSASSSVTSPCACSVTFPPRFARCPSPADTARPRACNVLVCDSAVTAPAVLACSRTASADTANGAPVPIGAPNTLTGPVASSRTCGGSVGRPSASARTRPRRAPAPPRSRPSTTRCRPDRTVTRDVPSSVSAATNPLITTPHPSSPTVGTRPPRPCDTTAPVDPTSTAGDTPPVPISQIGPADCARAFHPGCVTASTSVGDPTAVTTRLPLDATSPPTVTCAPVTVIAPASPQ